ncbi:MAG: biotin transporter BioY [Planctomycetes bacterium]|nr:biotin transporter BioY [Planctomycetota bacterium]MBI3848306.1 biotin transporter BioY [Planctomycetota bacterium]
MNRIHRDSAVSVPLPRPHLGTRLVLGTILVTLAMAISSQVRFPIPGTPVPFTLQPLVMLLAAGLLGGVPAAAAMIGYLALGMTGLPVFAFGGGAAYLLGPTGGFLIGMVPAALTAGLLAARWRSPFAIAAAFAVGIAVLFACGTAQLSIFFGRDLAATLRAHVYPFLIGDLVKVAIAAAAVAAWRARPQR